MKQSKIFKGISVVAILLFAIGILTISLNIQSVRAQESTQHMTQMQSSPNPEDHMGSLSPETQQLMAATMKDHHADETKHECSQLDTRASKAT